MLKKLSAILLILALMTQGVVSAESAKKGSVTDEKVEYFHKMYKKHQDFDKALELTLKKYKSLKVVQRGKPKHVEFTKNTGYFTTWGSEDIYSLDFPSEALIFDDDSDQYVYFGGWEWDTASDAEDDNPDDHVGVFTDDARTMGIDEVIINTYNRYGSRIDYMNSEVSGSRWGKVHLAHESSGGVSFWIHDAQRGSLSAYLNGVSTDTSEEVRTQYHYSWTERNITGIGLSVELRTGIGFDVSWETGVEQTDVRSSGVDYSDL